jgi:serine/threonine protein kinase
MDPTQEWVKKSWNKKKEKKLTINDFEQIKDLGSGKYGHVYLTREKKTNFICALKII